MPIQTVPLSGASPYLYIASYNKSKTKTGLTTINNPILNSAVLYQIGQNYFNEFKDDFINYKTGVILCVNNPFDLNKFFQGANAAPSGGTGGSGGIGVYTYLSNSVVFTVVRMPEEFINQKGNLTKDYQYGEKLGVINSKETFSSANSLYQLPNTPYAPAAPTKNSLVSYDVRRDANIRGRSVKTKSTSSGGGVGVWS
jgi:hypothetical protein